MRNKLFINLQDMDHSISDELYSEALKLSNGARGSISQVYNNQPGSNDKQVDYLSNDDDGSIWDDCDLDSWQQRRDQFHNIGYRDGLTAGKEASAQEGFNKGCRESILFGYKWGIVRGVTSALSCLPDGLREKLVESREERDKFQSLHESVHSLSTTDALKSFHDSIVAKRPAEQKERAEASDAAHPKDESSDILQNYSKELKALILKTPTVEVNFKVAE